MKKTTVYLLAACLGGWGVFIGGAGHARGDDGFADPPKHERDTDGKKDDADKDEPLAGPKNPHRDEPRADDDEMGDDEFDDDEGMRGDRKEWGPARDGSRSRRGRGRGPGRFRDGGPPPGEGPRGRFGPEPRRPLPPEELEEILGVIEAKLPDMWQRMEKAKQRNPDFYRRAVQRIAPMMREFLDLQKDHPDMAEVVIEEFKIERDVRELVRDFKNSEGDAQARDAVVEQIRVKLTRQHELQLQRRRFRLAQFRERLEREQMRLAEEQQRIEDDANGFDRRLDERMELIRDGRFREAFRRRDREMRGPREEGDRRRDRRGPDRRRGRPPLGDDDGER